MSKTPRDNPTPNPIARGLSDVRPCVGDSCGAVEVIEEVVCVVDSRGLLDVRIVLD
jgi:hypothetical protein